VIPSPYLTAREAIAYLKLGSQSALYRLVREHRLPSCRRGRLYLFDTRELDAWVHGHDSAIEMARRQRPSRRLRGESGPSIAAAR
jgi:excisionase family DNA binding protein